MISEILSVITALAAAVSAIVAAKTLRNTVKKQNEMQELSLKLATIEAFSKLQTEVLDKLVSMDKNNAQMVVENRFENEQCKEAYNDYRTLLARLDHFSIGVINNVYDFDLVNELGGDHLIYLLRRIEPIIESANSHNKGPKYYINYMSLVKKLEERKADKQ